MKRSPHERWGGRSRRSSRFERNHRKRSARARAHYARVRGENVRPSPWGRVHLVALALGSVSAGALLAVAIGELVVRWSAPLPRTLTSIAIQDHNRLEAAEVAQATRVQKGAGLDRIDAAAVEAQLLAHPWIADADALVLPTGQLLVRILEREPAAVLGDGADAEWQLVDHSGTPFAPAQPEDLAALPHLHTTHSFELGEAVPALSEAVALVKVLDERVPSSEPQTLRLPEPESGEGWVLRRPDRSLEAVLGTQQIPERIDRLALLLASDLPEIRQASRIDLRFAERAIVTSTSETNATTLSSSGWKETAPRATSTGWEVPNSR